MLVGNCFKCALIPSMGCGEYSIEAGCVKEVAMFDLFCFVGSPAHIQAWGYATGRY